MRTFMTLVTLGAAGAGYVYLNRTPDTGETHAAKSEASSLFDWHWQASPNSPRVAAQDLFHQVHQQTRSVLDDMTSQHAGHSDAPVDDAFQRLRQVTQSTPMASGSGELSVREVSNTTKPPIVPLPNLDEPQRTAFDPAADPGLSVNSTSQSGANPADSKSNLLEPTAKPDRAKITEAGESASPAASTPVARTSQPAGKPASTRTTGASSNRNDSAKTACEWKVVGKSTQGLPMHTVHLGEGGTRTLVIAGFNGEDRTAVRWLELLVDELARRPDLLKNHEFVFFRAANPDGLMQFRKENARGVAINRNFPSRRYRPSLDTPRHTTPAGEVETRVILDTLYSFRPRRVIHLASTTGHSQVLYNRLAKNVALELERAANIKLAPLDSDLYPGSIEDFSEGTLEAAVLSLRLSVGNDWNQAWNALHKHVLNAVAGLSFEPGDGDGEQIFDPDRSPIPPTNAEPIARQTRRRGYEELPPPPD